MKACLAMLVLSMFMVSGCTSPPPPAEVHARTATGHPVLLRADMTWIHDVAAMEPAEQNAVMVCGWTPSDEFEGILRNRRLVGEGLTMGIPVHRARTVDAPGAVWRDTAGILLRGDIPAGIRQELLNQVAAGRRAFVFLNVKTLDEHSHDWLVDELGLSVLRTEPYSRTDGAAIAYFCEGLDVDLGAYWLGQEWEIHAETELKVSAEWSRLGVVDGRVLSAYRPWGQGELIVSALGASPRTFPRTTPVDDGAIERGENREMARRLLRWLSEGRS